MKKSIMLLLLVLVMVIGTVAAYGTSDPEVTIVSPGQTVYGGNLLVSVKITAPKTVTVFVYEEKQRVGDTLVSIDPAKAGTEDMTKKTISSVSLATPETYTGTSSLQFYNKQFNDVGPGLYRIKVDTLDASGAAIASSSIRVAVMPKGSESEAGSEIFTSQQSGALQWVQNLLRSIFGN